MKSFSDFSIDIPSGVSGNVRTTRAQAISRGLTTYFTGKPCPKGHVSERFVSNYGCAECLKSNASNYHRANRESRLQYMRDLARRNPESNARRSRKWYHASPENKKKNMDGRSKWRAKNKKHVRAKARFYSQSRRRRLVTPEWADKSEIERIFRECPIGMEVDHVVPVAGKNVCGLHVAENLQYLTKSENCKKGVSWDG